MVLRRSAQVRRRKHSAIAGDHLPPLIPLSRVANIRSVHTLASVHAHCGATSLPCLALGTPGRSSCPGVSFTFPPSYPPWLHGRYPLLRYDGGSDSCPAPSRTRTGILDYRSCTSRHPVSNHPMSPSPCHASGSGQASPPIRLASYRRFVGLRSLLAVSSVASGRIEFVSQIFPDPSVLQAVCSLSVALHPTSR